MKCAARYAVDHPGTPCHQSEDARCHDSSSAYFQHVFLPYLALDAPTVTSNGPGIATIKGLGGSVLTINLGGTYYNDEKPLAGVDPKAIEKRLDEITR